MDLCCSRKRGTGLTRQRDNLYNEKCQRSCLRPYIRLTDLATPAHSQTRPFLDSSVPLPQLLHQFRHLLGVLRRSRWSTKEVSHLLLLLIRVRRKDGEGKGFAVKEVRHEDLILVVLVCMGEDVGSLEGLWAITKDVVDDENGRSCA